MSEAIDTTAAAAEPQPKPIVTVYSKPRCQQCTATYRWLDKNGVEYSSVDLSQDPEALAACKALGYEGAPVVIVNLGDTLDEKHWYGFRPDNLEEFTLPKETPANA